MSSEPEKFTTVLRQLVEDRMLIVESAELVEPTRIGIRTVDGRYLRITVEEDE